MSGELRPWCKTVKDKEFCFVSRVVTRVGLINHVPMKISLDAGRLGKKKRGPTGIHALTMMRRLGGD